MMKWYYSFKYLTCLFIIHFILIWICPAHGAPRIAPKENIHTSNQQILTKMSALQVPFIANEGQVDKEVSFYAKTFGGTLYVTEKGEIVYSLPRISKAKSQDRVSKAPADNKIDVWVLRESLIGAYKIHPEGMDKAKTKVNYFIGSDKKRWKSNISTYNNLSLGRVYDGIELALKAYGNNIEKVFTVYPKGKVSDIRLKIDGASSMKINPDGKIEIKTGLGPVRFSAPLAFQEIDGKRKPVKVSYYVNRKTYGFQADAYDQNHPLIIDPLLASTFIGGTNDDYGYSIALDSSNNVYVTGYTDSSDYPATSGAYDNTHNGNGDVFVSKLTADLVTLSASTFIGGAGYDCSRAIALDSLNNVYVTGETWSSDYPATPGAYDQIQNGSYDVFVSKLSNDLSLTQYYVDISRPDNSGDGTSWATAWKTLHYAIQQINAASPDHYLLNVAAGTYSVPNEADATLVINQDNVTIQGAGAGSTIINGIIDSTWQIGIEVNASNVTISGLEVSNFTMNGINIYSGTGQIVEDCDIHDNDWGIYTNNTSPEIRKNKIYDNTKGIYITVFSGAYTPVIKNNLIYTPAGTMEYGIEVYAMGTGSTASPSIYHNTIDGGTQDGIYIHEEYTPPAHDIKFNIITNFGQYGINNDPGLPGNPVIEYNDVNGNATNYGGNLTDPTGTNGNISLDPSFVGGGDYNLQSGSPCIDAIPTGDPVSDDIVGNTRPQGSGYDMGCYEYLTPTQYTLTVTIVGQGSVDPTGGTYNEDTVVTLTAVADSGWDFSAWSGDLTGSTNPDTITMDADKSVTATFTLNSPPDTPTTSSPADEAILSSGPVTIDTSIFSDPDSGDTHTESHWLVKRADSVYYRSDYDASFNVLTASELTQHTVSGLSSGMKYVWKVGYTDSGSGETSWSEEYDFKIGTSEADSSVEIDSGTEEADFTMVSFVQWPDHSTSSSVFDLTYDKKYFRIGTYDPTNGSGGYVEYGSSLMIEPGKAYWFLARDGFPITVNGIPVSLVDDIDVGLLYNASNQNGWNMIGCPNAANYNWDDVQVIEYNPNDGSIVFTPTAISDLPDTNDYIEKSLWRWESGTYYSDATLMEKYKGYWVKAKKANVFLRFTISAQTASISNPPTYFARLLSNGKRWMKRWVFTPQVAIADSNDSPPRPMGDFSTVSPDSVGGCFIATAVYGSPMEPHVTILRDFRDTYLLNSTIGHMFVKAYYRYSPPVADFIAKRRALKAAARMGLLPMVAFCYSALHFGLVVSACELLLIFMPFIFLVLVYKRRA